MLVISRFDVPESGAEEFLARADAGQLASDVPDTTDLLAVARADVRRLVRRKDVAVEVHGEPTEVRGDPELVEHIVANLLTNADRHSAGRILVTVTPSADTGRLEVADDGSGFPPGLLPHALDRFARSDDRRRDASGAGLGLAIVASPPRHSAGR